MGRGLNPLAGAKCKPAHCGMATPDGTGRVVARLRRARSPVRSDPSTDPVAKG